MGLLDSFKQALNIAGTDLIVATDAELYHQGEKITGKILVKGGEYEQTADEISVTLVEFWTETRSTGTGQRRTTRTVTVTRKHDTMKVAGHTVIHPNQQAACRFALQLPANCRVTTGSTGWYLYVSMDVPGAIDPHGTVKLKVQPGAEQLAVLTACVRQIGFTESRVNRRWNGKSGAVHFRLEPPPALQHKLDYVRLELCQRDGGIDGQLVCDLQESSLGDYIKAMFNRDKVRLGLTLSREQLFVDGEVNFAAIAEAVAAKLEQALASK